MDASLAGPAMLAGPLSQSVTAGPAGLGPKPGGAMSGGGEGEGRGVVEGAARFADRPRRACTHTKNMTSLGMGPGPP